MNIIGIFPTESKDVVTVGEDSRRTRVRPRRS